MAEAAVAADLHEPLDVLGALAPEITLDGELVVDRVAQLADLVLGEVADGRVRIDAVVDEELVKLRDEIEANFKIEGDLRREVQADIRRKIEIGSYQGRRHRMGLPVRGQRTKTNARTRKGPKRTVAGKKKAK